MQSPNDNDNRPPRLRFELTSVEDREASIREGHYVGRDVELVYLTPHGSKDEIPRDPKTWLESCRILVDEGRLPMQWLKYYKECYKAWKEELEEPVLGTDIKVAGFIKPTELKLLQSLGVRSVEELSAASEELMDRIGMGSRGLKEKAKIWLSEDGKGKVAEEMVSLRIELEALKEALKLKDAAIEELKSKVKE